MQAKYNSFSNIKNIVFDFGGVILNIDYYALVSAFEKLGITNFDELFSQAKQTNLFDDFEMGLITNEEFVKRIQQISNLNLSSEQIIDAWNAILLDLPKERLILIKQLKESHRTFMLSNTNNIHIKQFEKEIDQHIGLNYYYSCFDKIYYSSQIKMRKPNLDIFEFVLKENNLIPSETLFIDDSAQHIEAANKLKIDTIFLEKGKTIFDVF